MSHLRSYSSTSGSDTVPNGTSATRVVTVELLRYECKGKVVCVEESPVGVAVTEVRDSVFGHHDGDSLFRHTDQNVTECSASESLLRSDCKPYLSCAWF